MIELSAVDYKHAVDSGNARNIPLIQRLIKRIIVHKHDRHRRHAGNIPTIYWLIECAAIEHNGYTNVPATFGVQDTVAFPVEFCPDADGVLTFAPKEVVLIRNGW